VVAMEAARRDRASDPTTAVWGAGQVVVGLCSFSARRSRSAASTSSAFVDVASGITLRSAASHTPHAARSAVVIPAHAGQIATATSRSSLGGRLECAMAGVEDGELRLVEPRGRHRRRHWWVRSRAAPSSRSAA
jgi:hypothetical protein